MRSAETTGDLDGGPIPAAAPDAALLRLGMAVRGIADRRRGADPIASAAPSPHITAGQSRGSGRTGNAAADGARKGQLAAGHARQVVCCQEVTVMRRWTLRQRPRLPARRRRRLSPSPSTRVRPCRGLPLLQGASPLQGARVTQAVHAQTPDRQRSLCELFGGRRPARVLTRLDRVAGGGPGSPRGRWSRSRPKPLCGPSGNGQGAHMRAPRPRSGAFGVPAQRPRGVRGAAPTSLSATRTGTP